MYFEEKTSIREKLKKLLKIERINKKIAQERVKIKKKRYELSNIKLSLKNSSDTISLLVDIRDVVRDSKRRKKKYITKRKYKAIKKLLIKKKRR